MLLALPVGTATAANHLIFPLPDFGADLFDPFDDFANIRPIFWSNSLQDVEWMIYRAGHPTSNQFRVLDPNRNLSQVASGGNDVSDFEVFEAIEEAIQEWDGVGSSSFGLDGPLFTGGFTRPGLFVVSGIDVNLDGANLVVFRDTFFTITDSSTIAFAVIFFLERDISANELEDFVGLPTDDLANPDENIDVDVNDDGVIDLRIPIKNYIAGEIIETDIKFNENPISSISDEDYYHAWPQDRGDVEDRDRPFVLGSLDIQAITTHELGHTAGVGHAFLLKPTMTGFLVTAPDPSPTDPYDMRNLEYDDRLALSLLYPSGSGAEIRGSLLEGNSLALEAGADAPVVHQPIYLGQPIGSAPYFFAPDVVSSDNMGDIQLIAQVLSGEVLLVGGTPFRYPASSSSGVLNLDPQVGIGVDTPVFTTLPDATIDSAYRFTGLAPGDDYVLYASREFSEPAVNLMFPQFADLENAFEPEFYGTKGTFQTDTSNEKEVDVDTGTTVSTARFAEPIDVFAGMVTSGIDIVTNDPEFEPPPPMDPTPFPVVSALSAPFSTVITLDGSTSAVNPGHLTGYSWTQISGPAVVLSAPNSAITTFSPYSPSTVDDVYEFDLVVTDGKQVSPPASVSVTIEGFGSQWLPMIPGETTILNQPNLSFGEVTSQEHENGTPAASTMFPALSVAGAGRIRTQTVASPGLFAGPDGNNPAYHLSTYSSKWNGNPIFVFDQSDIEQSSIASNSYSKVNSGGNFDMIVAGPQAVDPITAKYLYGEAQAYNVRVYYLPRGSAPTAKPGSYPPIEGGSVFQLDGCESSDPDGGPLNFQWTQTSGPAVGLSHSTSAVPLFMAPDVSEVTQLVFNLRVDDEFQATPLGGALQGSASVTMHVYPKGTEPPLIINSAENWNEYE